jgi:hypothetical protein
MHQLQRSWVRSQHSSAQWNLRGGRWSSAEYSMKKNEKIPLPKFTVFFTPVRGAGNTETVFTVQDDGTFLLSLYFRFHRKHSCVALVQRFPLPRPYHMKTTFLCIFLPCVTTIEGSCAAYMMGSNLGSKFSLYSRYRNCFLISKWPFSSSRIFLQNLT